MSTYLKDIQNLIASLGQSDLLGTQEWSAHCKLDQALNLEEIF